MFELAERFHRRIIEAGGTTQSEMCRTIQQPERIQGTSQVVTG